MKKIVAPIQPNARMTNISPNHLNIHRQIKRCPSAIGCAVSQSIAQAIIEQLDSG